MRNSNTPATPMAENQHAVLPYCNGDGRFRADPDAVSMVFPSLSGVDEAGYAYALL